MNMLTKVFAVTNAVFAVIFLSVVFALWSKETQWVKATSDVVSRHNSVVQAFDKYRLDKEREVEDARSNLQKAEVAVRNSQNEVTRLTGERTALEKDKNTLNAQVATNSDIIKKLTDSADALNKEIKAKSDELETVKGQLAQAKSSLDITIQSQTELAAAVIAKDDMINKQGIEINLLRKQNQELKTAREGGPAIGQPMPAAPIVAQVVRTDGKVVVLNAGERHDVVNGMQFMIVSEKDGWIGRVQVRKVDPDFSVADIMEVTPDPKKIVPGDRAQTSQL